MDARPAHDRKQHASRIVHFSRRQLERRPGDRSRHARRRRSHAPPHRADGRAGHAAPDRFRPPGDLARWRRAGARDRRGRRGGGPEGKARRGGGVIAAGIRAHCLASRQPSHRCADRRIAHPHSPRPCTGGDAARPRRDGHAHRGRVRSAGDGTAQPFSRSCARAWSSS